MTAYHGLGIPAGQGDEIRRAASLGSWESIKTAPEDIRIILAFPPVCRPRKMGERKHKSNESKRMTKRHGCDYVVRAATVASGMLLNGQWVPGRRAPAPYYDDPTHWMHMPALPEEYHENAG